MATLNHPEEVSPDATTEASPPNDPPEARRRQRIAALKGVFGIWADREDIPADGLDYQREMRAEWR
jgi:hypothetical protein